MTHVCGCACADCDTSHRRALAACRRQHSFDCRGGCDRPPRRHARVADGRCADERGAGTGQLGGQWCATVFACVRLCLLNSTPTPRDGSDGLCSCRFLFYSCWCIAHARSFCLARFLLCRRVLAVVAVLSCAYLCGYHSLYLRQRAAANKAAIRRAGAVALLNELARSPNPAVREAATALAALLVPGCVIG